MSNVGAIGVVGVILIVLTLLIWIGFTIRANNDPDQSGARGEGAKRGEVSGGVIHGSPGQQTRRDEAPRDDLPEERGPLDL